VEWLRGDPQHQRKISIIWKGMLELLPCLKNELVWRIGYGTMVRVGIDNFIGGYDCFKLSYKLIEILHSSGYHTLNHVRSSSE